MKKTSSGLGGEELAEFRAMQEEMLSLSREYGEARLAAWSREIREMNSGWGDFLREWQGALEQMSGFAFSAFDQIAAKGEAASQLLAKNWQQSLNDMSAEVTAWGEEVLATFDKVSGGWGGSGGGSDDGWLGFLGFDFSLGSLFHEGGVVEAHRGLVVNPESLMADERLVKVQTGEGILPRDAMVRLGEENFEALRSGRFETNTGSQKAHYEITIQVQSLDAAGVAGLDWDRIVARHLGPALQRDLARRW
jgi:hypothetical protein